MTIAIDPIVDTETITAGQLGKINDSFVALCRKNAVSLPKDAIQQVLENEGNQLAREMFEALRKRVERRSNMIIRRVTVNRDQIPKELVDATGRMQYIDSNVLNTMPSQGSGTEEVDLYFFNVGRHITIDEQKKALADMGLEPDYYAQIQLNIDDPSFATDHPNGAQWSNKDSRAYYISFRSDADGSFMNCGNFGDGWNADWWFAGRRPPSTTIVAAGTSRKSFMVTFDWSLPFDRMVQAGKYGYVNPDITEKSFPLHVKGTSEDEIFLLHFDRPVTSDQAIAEMDKQGLRPANSTHALVFGAQHFEEQRKHPIVFLGSSWVDSHDGHRVLYLGVGDGVRKLFLFWFDFDWRTDEWFAAVRK